jgi:hypothetical protein
MPDIIGSVPLYADDAGAVYVDPDDVEGVGALSPRRERRLSRRLDRLGRRSARISDRLYDDEEVEVQAAVQKMEEPADIYAAAAAGGMITENQYEGLGSATISAGGTGSLTDTVNRNIWVKSIVLDSDEAGVGFLLVTGITFAGLPLNVGSLGAPLRSFAHDSTRFGINFGRRLALTGQQIRITFSNVDSSGHTVSGTCIGDELNPFAMQKWMEQMLLQAAVSGFRGY